MYICIYICTHTHIHIYRSTHCFYHRSMLIYPILSYPILSCHILAIDMDCRSHDVDKEEKGLQELAGSTGGLLSWLSQTYTYTYTCTYT